MLRSRRIERVADAGQRRRLAYKFIAEKFIEAGQAEFERGIRRPVEPKVVTQILLRIELGIVARQTGREHEKV